MLPPPRPLLVASSLALALASSACASHEPPARAPAPPRVATAAATHPAAPPGHLLRTEVDRVLTTQGPPWVLRRVISEEVLRKDGKFAGWRLVGLPEEWSGIDLKPGDVVTRVNGLALETPDEAWEAWKSVARSAELKIDVMRDGAPRQVILPIDGAPSGETTKALGRDPGPQRAQREGAPPARRSIPLGGGTADVAEEESF